MIAVRLLREVNSIRPEQKWRSTAAGARWPWGCFF